MSKNTNIDPYEQLANAVVLSAVRDMRAALKKVKRGRKNEAAMQEIDSCIRFFRSPWFSVLTDVDPEYLIRKLYEEVGE